MLPLGVVKAADRVAVGAARLAIRLVGNIQIKRSKCEAEVAEVALTSAHLNMCFFHMRHFSSH